MKNFLSKLCRLARASQYCDVGIDRRLTVGSPSVLHRLSLYIAVMFLLLVVGVGNAWGDTETYSYGDYTGQGTPTTGSSYTMTKTYSSIGDTKFNGGASYGQFYANGTTTITPLSGSTITRVVLTATSKDYNGYQSSGTVKASAGSVTKTNNTTVTWTGSRTAAFTISHNKQIRWTSIVVTYTAASCSTPPTVGSSLTSVSATVNSITATVPISAIGGCNITENGLVYSTSNSTPTVGGTGCTKVTVTACGSTAANKTVTISGLTCGQSYYVRGYATNTAGTSYTNVTTQSTSACPKYTVTLMDDGDTRTQASYGASVTLPSRAGCSGYTFAGWTKTWVTAQTSWTTTAPTIIDAGSYTPTANENLYPVYTKTESGGSSNVTFNFGYTDWGKGAQFSGSDFNEVSQEKGGITATYTRNSGSLYANTTSLRFYKSNTLTFDAGSTAITAISFTGSVGQTDITTDVITCTNTSSSLSWSGNSTSVTFTRPSDASGYATLTSATLTVSSSTTSYISVPNCCTALGSINGSVNLTQTGTSVTVKGWTYTQGSGAAESNISTYDVYLYSDADSYADPIATQTCAYNAKGTGVTFTSLSYGRTYKIKIGATAATNYCDITPVQVTTINSTSTQTFQLACDVPTNVTATSVTASSATVSWDDVATNYQYVLDQSSSDPAGAGTAVNGAHSVNLSVSASTNYYFHVRTNCGNSVFSSWATISFSTPAAACTGYSFHDGTDGSNPSDWQINCFTYSGNSDRQWLKDFTIRNKSHYYVGYQGNFYNDNLGNSNAKSYTNQMQYMQLALDRTHGSNNQLGSNYAGVQGTLLCYDNSSADNLYVDFLPDGYYFILDAAGTPTALEMTCTNPDMTAANILSNNSVWETSIQTITYVNKKYTVGIKANSAIAGKTWQTTRYNTNEDMTTLKKRNSSGGFTGTLAAADVTAGTRGKYRIWADNFSTTAGEKNWYAHFVPYYRVTYNGNGADGSVAASADVSCEGTASQRTVKAAANGFEVPAHTSFGGWATSASGAKVYDPNDDIVLTTDVELFAIWTPEANASITLNNYTGSAAPTNLYAGDSWNLPSTNTYACGDKTFVGWSTVTVASTDTKPTSNFYEPGASVTLAASNTFYAVFANGGSNDYELVTSASTALAAGDEIIFASSGSAGNAKAMGKKNDNNRSSVDVTIADGGVIEDPTLATSTDNTTDIYPFVLETNGSDFAIKDVLHNQYLTANGAGTSGNNYLRTNDGPASATTQKFTISVDAEGAATITGHNDAANARNNMRYNGSNNPPIFSCYSSGQSPIYIYRKPPTTGYSTTCVACETVTVGYTASPTGGTVGVKKGATSIAPNGTVNVCGATVALTVRLTPATHYDITGFTATGLTTGTATITPAVGSTLPVSAEQEFTVTLSANATGTVTLTPTFTEDAYRTIVFKRNGSALFNDGGSATTFDGTNKWKQKVYLTEKPVWPTDLVAGQACDGSSTSFQGWVADGQTWSGKKDAVPAGSTLITDASGFAAAASGSGDVVYHAVWAEASGSGTPHYAKVTSTGDITNGDYLIVYETGSVAFDGSLATLDATSNTIDITISESKITANSTINASKFTIDVANRYIKSASDKYIDQSGWSNGLAGNDAATSVHSMSIDGSGNFVVEGTGNDGAGTPTYVQLKYNAENTQKRFRFYKSGQEDIQLYKYDAGATYSNFLTTCCENYAVTLTGSGVVGGGTFSASSMQPCVGSTIELSATLCSGYTQGAWTVAKTGTPATTVTVTNNQFTMPSYAVTVSLATTAKVDHFIDRMHSTDGYTGDGAERSGCNYTVPNLSNTSEPVGSNCDETHYIFVGWVDADHVGSNGALLSGYSIISGNSTQNATGTTYYAIWAQAL